MSARDLRCECFDAFDGHPVAPKDGDHNDESSRCINTGEQTLYRIDMHDETGTLFCDHCAADAVECGLFRGKGY